MKKTRRTLLLVEDSDDDAFLTTRAIKEAGITHRIERCSDGQSVITYLQDVLAAASSGSESAFPDLVLLDLKMPRLGGLEVLEWIRSQDAFRSLIVLAFTSSNEPRDVATAYQLHVNAYLVKPSSLREMIDLASSIRAFWLDQKHFIPPHLGMPLSGNQPLFDFMSNAPRSVRVLVVEDNPDDRELLLRQLRKSGMAAHVKFISDGREALDFLTGADADQSATGELIALFLDLKLPSLGGLEILRQIRLRDHLRHLPVIVMTSSNDPADLEECQRLKVANYITKPITFPAFAKAVADVFHPPRSGAK